MYNLRTAETFEDIDDEMLTSDITSAPYIQDFANTLMKMSNTLNSVKSGEIKHYDIEEFIEDYLPTIREFIVKTTGL